MAKSDDNFVDKVTMSCVKLYNELPKTGKPIECEWTVLSCIIQYDNVTGEFEVVSLGTGSKCIGASKMSPSGDVLNDSHAEVIARRGFLLYLYDNIDQALENKQSIFLFENGLFTLKESVEFIFYSSQLPCGDASIMSKVDGEDFGEVVQSLKRESEDMLCDNELKRVKNESDDIHRTGAKCLPDSEQDSKLPGVNYHLLGQVRTKPGRGERTLSVSCSDKMARWIHVGIQGALIDLLLSEPIFIKKFIFGAGVPYSEHALTRALCKRSPNDSIMFRSIPEFCQCSITFPHIKSETNVRPAPGSIIWSHLRTVEVAVQGRRLGVTKKKAKSLNNSLCISKYNIYRRFHSVLNKNEQIKQRLYTTHGLQSIPYNEMKRKSKRYLEKWNIIKNSFFKSWTKKPDMWDFSIKEAL